MTNKEIETRTVKIVHPYNVLNSDGLVALIAAVIQNASNERVTEIATREIADQGYETVVTLEHTVSQATRAQGTSIPRQI